MAAATTRDDLTQRLLERALREWRLLVSLRALLAGVALALTAAATLVMLDQIVSLPVTVRFAMRFLPVLILAAGVVRALSRASSRPDDQRLSLLVEEHRPELGYQLVTLVGMRTTSGPVARACRRGAEASVASVSGRVVPLAIAAEARWLTAVAVLSVALGLLVPGGTAELARRWGALAGGPSSGIAPPSADPVGRTAAGARAAFQGVRVRVEPPAYTGLVAYELDESSDAPVLVGSRVVVEGTAPQGAPRVEARVLGRDGSPTSLEGGAFAFSWSTRAEDRGLEIVASRGDSAVARRVIALAARADAPPIVELITPERDLVLATANGYVGLRATARDDFGVESFSLSWILTRGSGESFSSTEGGAPWSTLRSEGPLQTGQLELDVAALGMAPGDVLHVRAVAEDGNSVGGPGRGVSRTGVIRIAQADRQDEANTLIGFPIEPEGDPVLTQRMIVLLTERLVERAPSRTREALRAEAEEVARAQARVRERFEDVVYARTSGVAPDPADPAGAHDHDADPALAVNRELVPALDAMFEAEGHLRLSEPAAALPAEYRALEIVQRAREAERVFVRGSQTVAPVDVEGARGTGSLRDVEPAPRTPGRATESTARYLPRLAALVGQGRPAPEAALQISALAAELLADPGADARAGALLVRAARATEEGRVEEAASLINQSRALLAPPAGGSRPSLTEAVSAAGAAFMRAVASPAAGGAQNDRARSSPGALVRATSAQPFVFATARYASGDWDSAPLVPANLIHSLALYTDIPVLPDGVIVDLASPDLFRHPFVFLTGHLPVQFTSAEAANLRAYVDRGGFLFIDDHNHDIDGAFHRTVTAELSRVFGDGALAPLPNEHELYRAFFVFANGPPTTSHELNGWGDGLVHEALLAIERNGRIGVLYSNKDYASEWSYHAANKRFLGLDNTRFGVNVILHALTR
jgi:hypothetical protein